MSHHKTEKAIAVFRHAVACLHNIARIQVVIKPIKSTGYKDLKNKLTLSPSTLRQPA